MLSLPKSSQTSINFPESPLVSLSIIDLSLPYSTDIFLVFWHISVAGGSSVLAGVARHTTMSLSKSKIGEEDMLH